MSKESMLARAEERKSHINDFNEIQFYNKGFETFSKSSSRQDKAVVA